jgi:hypothetical protein
VKPGPIDLRPEANPLHFCALTPTQQEAYRRLAGMLAGAAASIGPPAPAAAGGIALEFDRKSRVAVVSGGRGTGKTTAVLSLVRDVVAGTGPVYGDPPPPRHEETADQKTLRGIVEGLTKRVVWLDILDMAPLPAAANLFSAVLVRVEETATRLLPPALAEEKPRSYLDPPEVYDSPLEELRRLQTDVAVSWEGNLDARSGALDASAFAAEVKRAEAVRMKLNPRLAKVLDGLATDIGRRAGVADPLFVLPVDDFDLNPPRCLELLELLRTLSVPRLFCLALGDVDVAETMCALQSAADVARVAGGAPGAKFLPVHEFDVQATVANVTGNVIRKLLPPGQRVYLEPMRVSQAVGLRPSGKKPAEPTVGDWLRRIPFAFPGLDEHIRKRFPQPRKVPVSPGGNVTKDEPPTLYDFLFAENNDDPSEPFYHARKFLEMPLRLLVDFWQVLEEAVHRGYPGEDLTQRFRKKLHYFCRDVFQAEESLPPDARRKFRASFNLDPDTGWTISPDPFRLVAATYPFEVRADAQLVPAPTPEAPSPAPVLRWTVHARGATGWEFSSPPREQETKPLFLAPATTDLIIFYTDLVTLSRGGTERNPLIEFRNTAARPWVVYHFWDRDLPLLSWPTPPFLTFWETDRFLDAWSRLLRAVDSELRGSETTPGPIPLLVFNWIRLGTAVLAGREPISRFSVEPPGAQEWAALRNEVEDLFSAAAGCPRVRESVHRWIAEVLSLLNRDVIGPDETPGNEFAKSGVLAAHCRKTNRRFAEWLLEFLRRERALPGASEDEFRQALRSVPAWWPEPPPPAPAQPAAPPPPPPPPPP